MLEALTERSSGDCRKNPLMKTNCKVSETIKFFYEKLTFARVNATYPDVRAAPNVTNLRASLRVVLYPAGKDTYSLSHACTPSLLVLVLLVLGAGDELAGAVIERERDCK